MPAAIPAAVAGVASIGGAIISSNAQKKATNKATEMQQESAAEQLAFLRDIYNQNTANEMPYLQSGYGAQQIVNEMLGINPVSAANFAGLQAPPPPANTGAGTVAGNGGGFGSGNGSGGIGAYGGSGGTGSGTVSMFSPEGLQRLREAGALRGAYGL